MPKIRLTDDDREYLKELSHVRAGRIYLESQRRLERAGLIEIHHGRYGEYARLAIGGPGAVAAAPADDRKRAVAEVDTSTRDRDPGTPRSIHERKAMITACKRIKKHQR